MKTADAVAALQMEAITRMCCVLRHHRAGTSQQPEEAGVHL